MNTEQANITHFCSLVLAFDKAAKQRSALKNTGARLTFINAFDGIKHKCDGYKKCNYFFCWPVEKAQELIELHSTLFKEKSAYSSIYMKIY